MTMNDFLLKENERIDDLQFMNLKIIQSPDAFRFGMDAVLLADFARARKGCRVCDLGTGTGILPLLLYGRTGGITCDAVEIQPDSAERAMRSMQLNGLEDIIRIHNLFGDSFITYIATLVFLVKLPKSLLYTFITIYKFFFVVIEILIEAIVEKVKK